LLAVLAAVNACALITQAAAAPKILLLLHGMNSSPSTWNSFVASQFSNSNNKGVILGGVLVSPTPTPNAKGVYCYAVEFGFYDKTDGRTGLEGVTANNATLPTAGDFTDFNLLGKEVDEAITYLLATYPGAQITLLGHSRGGIAARSYLQNQASIAPKASVISLLTTGAPHKGSHLGRIYSWLATHPRSDSANANDWKIVDQLSTQFSFDVRRPVINDFADNGSAVSTLNSGIAALPAALAYGNLRYIVTDLGYLGRKWGISYSVFQGINLLFIINIPPLSAPAKAFVLAGKTPSDYKGDGTVEADSQNLLNIAGVTTFSKKYDMTFTKSVYHTEETATGQVADMTAALHSLTGWW
jgi:triacylglycerol esterase/lipase EstA (alpha/beta hydrolase family)